MGKFEHDSVTEPVKLPAAEIEREVAGVVPPGATLKLDGEGALSEKSTICKLSKKSWVSFAASDPTACKLNA